MRSTATNQFSPVITIRPRNYSRLLFPPLFHRVAPIFCDCSRQRALLRAASRNVIRPRAPCVPRWQQTPPPAGNLPARMPGETGAGSTRHDATQARVGRRYAVGNRRLGRHIRTRGFDDTGQFRIPGKRAHEHGRRANFRAVYINVLRQHRRFRQRHHRWAAGRVRRYRTDLPSGPGDRPMVTGADFSEHRRDSKCRSWRSRRHQLLWNGSWHPRRWSIHLRRRTGVGRRCSLLCQRHTEDHPQRWYSVAVNIVSC